MTTRHEGPVRARVQLGRVRFLAAVALVVVVVVVRAWLGVWPAAVVGATALTAGLVAGWAAIDRRLFAPRAGGGARPVVVVERGPRGRRPFDRDGGHVAFARGLAGLAGWYLAECERQEREPQP